MNQQITFRHIDSQPAIEGYLKSDCLPRIERFLSSAGSSKFVLEEVEHSMKRVSVHVSDKDLDFSMSTEGKSFYEAIDSLRDKCIEKLRRTKDQRSDHKGAKLSQLPTAESTDDAST